MCWYPFTAYPLSCNGYPLAGRSVVIISGSVSDGIVVDNLSGSVLLTNDTAEQSAKGDATQGYSGYQQCVVIVP